MLVLGAAEARFGLETALLVVIPREEGFELELLERRLLAEPEGPTPPGGPPRGAPRCSVVPGPEGGPPGAASSGP